MRSRLGVPVVVRYTSTETSLGTGTRPGDPDEVVAQTVGRPVPGVELMIVDGEGRPVPAGEVGRVRLRSGAVMRGLWADRPSVDHRAPDCERARLPARGDDPPPHGTRHVIDRAATARVLSPDGWVSTGDFGMLCGENLRLVGRDNELYIRGGYNVYPAEVEEALAAHEAVGQVAVVGTKDRVLGEVGVAFIVASEETPTAAVPTAEDLRAFVARSLADYKVPDAIVIAESLPLTPMMKVDKRALADAAANAATGLPARGHERRRRDEEEMRDP
jgi:acyl-CoA synthetase (AMP-forming)/AMP-acid ligase II